MNAQLIARFTRFAEEAERKYGVICQLAEIRGARWSYVAGARLVKMPVCEPERVPLGGGLGLVIYDIDGFGRETVDNVRSKARSLWGRLPIA